MLMEGGIERKNLGKWSLRKMEELKENFYAEPTVYTLADYDQS
jgi:hypothetical protein